MPVLSNYNDGTVSMKTTLNFSLDKLVQEVTVNTQKRLLVKVSKYTQDVVRKRFIREKDSKGRRWKKLSPLTIARKGSSKILKK